MAIELSGIIFKLTVSTSGQTSFGDSPLTLPVTTSVVSSFGGDRTVYRIEAVWDSSLHNSDLLNKPGMYRGRTLGSKTIQLINWLLIVFLSYLFCQVMFPTYFQLPITSIYRWKDLVNDICIFGNFKLFDPSVYFPRYMYTSFPT